MPSAMVDTASTKALNRFQADMWFAADPAGFKSGGFTLDVVRGPSPECRGGGGPEGAYRRHEGRMVVSSKIPMVMVNS